MKTASAMGTFLGRTERESAVGSSKSGMQTTTAKSLWGLSDVIAAARDLGGCGACLSGAGPTVLALCRGGLRGVAVGREMKRAFARHGVKAKSLVLNPDMKGVQVL